MNSTYDSDWCGNAWRALEACRPLLGEAFVQEAKDRWAAHASRDRPVLTLFGSYGAGKTSLLKRLLAEAGAPIPPWATVSGGRETFERNEVEAGPWTIRDLPGISTGDAIHEQVAAEGLELSDAYLVCLLPQLLTAERVPILHFLAWTDGQKGLHPCMEGALVLCVGQIDTMGPDPLDMPEAFRGLLGRKEAELGKILRAEGIASCPPVAFVSADPGGQFSRERNIQACHFDASRSWDGLDRLKAALRDLEVNTPELRRKAEARFLLANIQDGMALLQAARDGIGLERQKVVNDSTRLQGVRGSLDSLARAAELDLKRILEEGTLGAGRRISSFGKKALDDAMRQLEKSTADWWDRHVEQLCALAQDLEVALDSAFTLPGAPTPPPGVAGDESMKGGIRYARRILETLPRLQEALRQHHESKLGVSLTEASKEIKRIKEAGGLKKLLAAEGRSKGKGFLFKESEVSGVEKILKFHAYAAMAITTLTALYEIWAEIDRQGESEKAAAKKRKEAESRLHDDLEAMAREIMDRYNRLSADLAAKLLEGEKQISASLAALVSQDSELAQHQAHLKRMVS